MVAAAVVGGCLGMGKGGGGGANGQYMPEYAVSYNDAYDDAQNADRDFAANDDGAIALYKSALEWLDKATNELDMAMKAGSTKNVRFRTKPNVRELLTDVQLKAKIDGLRAHIKQQMGLGVIVTRDKSETLRTLETANNWLAGGDKAGSAKPTEAYRDYKEAERLSGTQLFKVAAAKQSKQWKEGQRYQAKDGVISEAELLARLGKVREDATARAKSFEQPAFAAWGKKYGKLSEGQKRMLVTDGDPPTIDRKKCWVYPTDEEPVCWDAKGNRKFRKRKVVASRPQGGGGGDEGAGEAAGNDGPDCGGRAELDNGTFEEIHYSNCGQNDTLGSSNTTDLDAGCTLVVEGHSANPKPCQRCRYDGSSLRCE